MIDLKNKNIIGLISKYSNFGICDTDICSILNTSRHYLYSLNVLKEENSSEVKKLIKCNAKRIEKKGQKPLHRFDFSFNLFENAQINNNILYDIDVIDSNNFILNLEENFESNFYMKKGPKYYGSYVNIFEFTDLKPIFPTNNLSNQFFSDPSISSSCKDNRIRFISKNQLLEIFRKEIEEIMQS